MFFSSGQYCICKRGRCPAGLTTGFVNWDDDDYNSQFNKKGGILPGGIYDHDTKIRFCCRTDGNKSNPISIPSKTPFFLLTYGSAECQMVKWAITNLEWIRYDTEHNYNEDKAWGEFPYDAGNPHPTIYYCYYRGK